MQTPTTQTPVSRLVAVVRFLLAALVQQEETADLVPALRAVFDTLVASITATAAAGDATIGPRVALRFAERRVELAIRMLAIAARGLDNGKAGGRVATTLFPDGLSAALVPQTEEQHAVATQLLHRLAANDVAAPLRAVHEAAIQAGLGDLRTCIDTRDAAVSAYDVAFQRELAARDAMIRAYDSVANSVRSRFPKDRQQQDVFFETLRSTKSGSDDEPVIDAQPTPVS